MFLRVLVLAVTFTYSLGWPQVSQQQGGKTSTPKGKSNREAQPVPPMRVVIEEPIPTVRTQPTATGHQDQGQEKPLPQFVRPEWVIVYITAIYVIFTVLTWIAIRSQVKRMDQQLIDNNKSSTDALTALNRQITALESHVKATEENAQAAKMGVEAMIAKERARVRVKPERAIVEAASNPYPMNSVKYKTFCFGATPAFIIDATWATEASALSEPPTKKAFAPISLDTLFLPDQAGTERSAIIFDKEANAEEISNGKQFIYFWGSIHYTDVFGIEHETRFCYRWQATNITSLDGNRFCYWQQCGGKDANLEI